MQEARKGKTRSAVAKAVPAPAEAPVWQIALTGMVAAAALTLTAWSARADAVTVAHGYSNFGSLKYEQGFTHLDYVNPDAPKGGTYSESGLGNFDSFNPYTRKGRPAQRATIGVESLMAGTADDAYGMYCFLCTTLEYPENLDWVVFNLRDDVTFADGTPMTAADVEFSFNLILEQGIFEYRSVVSSLVTNVEVLGPYQIKFTFSDTAPMRERISFAGSSSVFSKAWFEKTGARLDERSDAPFMTTGAYMLDNHEYNRFVTYKRNPDYWGYDHPLNVGTNNFDKIHIVYFGDGTAALEGFKAGTYTFRNENSSKDWALSYDFPAMKSGDVVKEEITDETVGQAQSFIFNLDRTNWQDKRVRDAIEMMFNFEWSNETLFYGLYERVDSFWPGSDLAAAGAPSAGEIAILQPLVDQGLIPESVLSEDAPTPTENRAGDSQPSRKVLRAASKLLDEAGWVVGDDGTRSKNGQPLTLTFVTFSPLFDRIINPYIENLQRIGVQAKLDRVDSSQLIEREREGKFDLVTHSFTLGFEPGEGLKQWFASSTADDSSRNLMRLRDTAVDALLPVVSEAQTLEDLRTAVHALDRVLRHRGFMVPQWYKNKHTVAYYNMYEHPEDLPPYALGQLDFWWISAEKEAALKASGALR
ncbi:extracellular solute-binding protein [Aliiroseovarius sp. KMU-50]|uniref:Extracellular solute-binding protein n=1 Tax=Aliiroseovarius salicola TaxID=3009082 RepID=A0ABT4VWF3_9RHOB|nr:extracellular solute-binding protein [Aliiroseovarius sp. KMU-50]MDA5092579.1 extracellular solute-binding protein [Aliiroseovarius sp. KMU-50]